MPVAQLEPRIDAAEGDVMAPAKQSSGWAWGICWLMFASTILNYMDRQALALVNPQIKKEFSLTEADYGWVLAAFMLTYALVQVPAGYLVDRWNVRWAYAGAVVWWSAAGMATAFSPTLGVFMMFRGVLGIGESFNWPCALRVTRTILPPADRSLGNGIFNSGAAAGAVVTPLIVTYLTVRFGWRTSFLAIGGLGFFWVAAWLILMGGQHRQLFQGRRVGVGPAADGDELSPRAAGLSHEARLVFSLVAVASVVVACSGWWRGAPPWWRGAPAIAWGIALFMAGLLLAGLALPRHSLSGADWTASLGTMVRLPRFWIMVVVSVTINICWHFLVNWVPTFLKGDRNFTYLASGVWTSVPFLAAAAGNLGGGLLARVFANRSMTPAHARMTVMALCMLLISSGTIMGWVPSDKVVIVLLALMAMGTAAFMANFFAFAQEVSARHTGLVVGVLGGLGNLFAAGSQPLVGGVKDSTGSFKLVFVLVGLLPFLGLGALILGWRGRPEEAKSS
jgi:ACS family hexuronate transporter-like MFS transporter